MEAHDIIDQYDGKFVASVKPASPEMVKLVLGAPEEGYDGRSPWVWIRLCNGDLILGVFPQGDTYLNVERDAQE